MTILRFRSKDEHEELLNKTKKMKKYLEDIEDCLEDAVEDTNYRGVNYRREYDEDDMRRSRYDYRR